MSSTRYGGLISGSFEDNLRPQPSNSRSTVLRYSDRLTTSDTDPSNKRPSSNFDISSSYDAATKRARRTAPNPSASSSSVIDLTQDDEVPPESRLVSLSSRLCVCGKPCDRSDNTVFCASVQCRIVTYHRACVGLANKEKYRDTSKWRCSKCRNLTVPAPAASLSQLQSSQTVRYGDTSLPATSSVTAAPVVAPEPALHPEQIAVVECIERGHNTFYTGSGGVGTYIFGRPRNPGLCKDDDSDALLVYCCYFGDSPANTVPGKSTVLKAFVKSLRAQGKQVDITAPSGIAAIAIDGKTIFSYAGWHPDSFKESVEKLISKAMGKTVRRRLCKTDVLVIDEISMVERDMLTRLDAVMRAVRDGYHAPRGEKRPQSRHSSRLPFGGVQIVVTGDFCQLPPVKPFQFCINCGGAEMEGWSNKGGENKHCKKCRQVYEDKDKWAFMSPAWDASEFTYFELKHIHRQSDRKFISILQKLRYGHRLHQDEEQLLLQKRHIDGAVKLLPQKREVNQVNQQGLRRLQGTSRHYECLDFFEFRNENEQDLKLKAKPLYPERPQGPLMALKDHRFEEKLELKLGMRVILLVNLELTQKLVNGAQGTIVNFEPYDPNITYVQRPPDSDPSRPSKESDEMSELAALKEGQIHSFIQRAPRQEWPVVKFDSGITKTIPANCQINELGSEKPYSRLGRTTIPLLPAWAITIHKSQGMTLEKVSVDLGNSFEREMGYVALSRARSLEGLEVIRLPKNAQEGMDQEVLAFLQKNIWKTAPVV